MVADLKIGILCYLHLWASLNKHVSLSNAEIADGIGLWDDHQGGYFAAFTLGNHRALRINETYVCALGDEGPMVGQFEQVPSCTPLNTNAQIDTLMKAMAQTGPKQAPQTTMQQVDVVAQMLASLTADRSKIVVN